MNDIDCCTQVCDQGHNCPVREHREIPGTGIVLSILLVTACFAIACLAGAF